MKNTWFDEEVSNRFFFLSNSDCCNIVYFSLFYFV